MYRGRDSGWHHGHHDRDVPPPRNYEPRPYRGGYHDHREHDNYGQYYDHNSNENRDFNDEHYVEYEESSYHREAQPPYHEYRESRGQRYQRGGRHNSGYQEYQGGYWSGRGRSGKYTRSPEPPQKKYSYKYSKSYTKESDRAKDSSPKPIQTVIHNPGPNTGTVSCESPKHTTETKDKRCTPNIAIPSQEDTKSACSSTKPEESNKKPTQDEMKPVENGANSADNEAPLQVDSAEPSEEDTDIPEESNHLADCMKFFSVAKVKTEKDDAQTDLLKHNEDAACAQVKDTMQSSYNRKLLANIKPEEEELPLSIFTGKRTCMEEFSIKTEVEEAADKRARKSHVEEDHFCMDKIVEIPLLDGWPDIPSDTETPGTSTQESSDTAVKCETSETAQELRKAFILAKKEEIELGFCQDCRTFAYVANTLLKKDPSIEAAVTNALRSCLQDIAGRCVQELSNFIEQYDKVIYKTADRLTSFHP